MFMLTASYIKPVADVESQAAAHGDWIKRYLKEGAFLFAGPKKSGLGGVIGVKSMPKSELMKILAEDSYVQADVAEYQIVEFDCKVSVPAFSGLTQS